MNSIVIIVIYLCYVCNCSENMEVKFDNTIEAVGFPYYKMLMALGDCKGTLSNLFDEDKRTPNLNFITVSLF